MLNAGSNTLSVVFTPSDLLDYIAVTNTVSLVVSQAIPALTWTNPAPIIYGTAFISNQLAATANVLGSFTYAPTNGAVLDAGTNTLSVVFAPIDLLDYISVTNTVSLVVSQAIPALTWSNPAPIIYGTALSSNQLAATANVLGSFTYAPTNGAVLTAGTNTLSVVFTPIDLLDYISVTNTVSLVVSQAIPALTWTNPAPIIYGTALSSNQLAATANVLGSFAYTPTNGLVLNKGTNTLSVVFTPTDLLDYISVTNTVSLAVAPASLTITTANATRYYTATNPVFTGTITGLTNGDNITVTYNCNATSNSPVGNYSITPSLVDPDNRQTNYIVSLVSGILTVTELSRSLFLQRHRGSAGSYGHQ